MKALITTVLSAAVLATAASVACPLSDKARATVATTGDVVVRSPGKAHAAIDVNYRLQGKPAIGQSLQLEVTLVSAAARAITADVNAAPELGLAAQPRARIASGDSLLLTLTPQSEGRFHVNVIARDHTGMARVVSIPVQVGKAKRHASKAEATPSGELIVRLPAAH